MALSDEQIEAIFKSVDSEDKGRFAIVRLFARAIETEVRKDDEALIRQLRDALESAEPSGKVKNAWVLHEKAIDAANARLGEKEGT